MTASALARQGPVRHRRADDDLRLGDLRRPRADRDRRGRRCGCEAAGYANVGKTNLHEFAYGTTSENPHFGTVPNPIAPGRIAGGSSGGSAAALAAGLVEAALGTDTGGSIRIPAACCGIVGFKPTLRARPAHWLLPARAEPRPRRADGARRSKACIEMMRPLVPGFEPRALESLEDVQVGIAWARAREPLVRARVEEAAAHFPRAAPGRATPRRRLPHRLHARGRGHAPRALRRVCRALQRERRVEDRALPPGHRRRSTRPASAPASATASSSRSDGRHRPARHADAAVRRAPRAARTSGTLRRQLTLLTWPLNVLGTPALAIPCGPAEDGLPASVQIAGRQGDDALVLGAGALLESLLKR